MNQKLRKEYWGWKISDKQNQLAKNFDAKKAYEFRNILERWNLSRENFGIKIALEKMINEIFEKELVETFDEIGILAKKVAEIYVEQIFTTPKIIISKAIVSNDGTIKYDNYERRVSPNRVKLLRKAFNKYGKGNFEQETCLMSMRYSRMVPGSQQWNLPKAVYEVLVKNYGVEIEGFASPFNSQMMEYGGKFCSLFFDVDQNFGSAGDFFECSLVGKKSVINPPYIIDILNDVVEEVIGECQKAQNKSVETIMFITVADWTDADFYQKLDSSQFLIDKLTMEPLRHYYENSNDNDRKIISKFRSSMFILGTGVTKKYNFQNIKKVWSDS